MPEPYIAQKPGSLAATTMHKNADGSISVLEMTKTVIAPAPPFGVGANTPDPFRTGELVEDAEINPPAQKYSEGCARCGADVFTAEGQPTGFYVHSGRPLAYVRDGDYIQVMLPEPVLDNQRVGHLIGKRTLPLCEPCTRWAMSAGVREPELPTLMGGPYQEPVADKRVERIEEILGYAPTKIPVASQSAIGRYLLRGDSPMLRGFIAYDERDDIRKALDAASEKLAEPEVKHIVAKVEL